MRAFRFRRPGALLLILRSTKEFAMGDTPRIDKSAVGEILDIMDLKDKLIVEDTVIDPHTGVVCCNVSLANAGHGFSVHKLKYYPANAKGEDMIVLFYKQGGKEFQRVLVMVAEPFQVLKSEARQGWEEVDWRG